MWKGQRLQDMSLQARQGHLKIWYPQEEREG